MSAVKAISFVTHVYQMSQMIIISGQYLSNERKKIPYSRSSKKRRSWLWEILIVSERQRLWK